MEEILPLQLDPIYTSDWDGPFDGQDLDQATLDSSGYGLFPWQIVSDNEWWCRPLKLGEIGCTLAHWACWQDAYTNGTEPYVLMFEDDIVLEEHFVERLLVGLDGLDGRKFHLLYLGRYPLEPDTPVRPGIVSPGYSHCTFAYLVTRDALPILLATRLDRAIVPVDEFLPSLCIDHPREDLRLRYPRQLVALAFEPSLARQLPKDVAGSDTEDSAFVDW